MKTRTAWKLSKVVCFAIIYGDVETRKMLFVFNRGARYLPLRRATSECFVLCFKVTTKSS